MRASIREVRHNLPNKIIIEREGDVSTRPRYSFRQKIEMDVINAPQTDPTYPLPEFYTWDRSLEKEVSGKIRIHVSFSREVEGVKELDVHATQWVRRGHIWREIIINGMKHTQEIWYKEGWQGHELKKDLWIEWDRSAREEIHITEMDGLRVRYFFRKAKEDMGEPPGFFWYREATLSLSPTGRLWRLALLPEITEIAQSGVGQDLGFHKWPSDVWLKYWFDGKRLWMIKEIIKGETVERMVNVETKRLKLL